MISDFGSAVLPELTDIPRLEPQGEWLPRPLQDMLFFHIVHKRPGALHTRPVRDGGQARADECAIAPHIVRHVSLDDHYVLVNLSSVQPGGAFTHQSFLLSLNSLPWKTLIRMTCWEPDGDSVWTLPDKFLENEAITQEQRPHLDTLLRKALLPSAPVDGVPLPEEARALIQKLVDADVLESVENESESVAEQYTLTEKGKLLAMPLLKLVNPRRAHVARQVKLKEMTKLGVVQHITEARLQG